MNTQVHIFAPGMAVPGTWRDAAPRSRQLPSVRYPKQAPQIALISALWITRGLLQVVAIGIGMSAGLALVLITMAKDSVTDLMEARTSGTRHA